MKRKHPYILAGTFILYTIIYSICSQYLFNQEMLTYNGGYRAVKDILTIILFIGLSIVVYMNYHIWENALNRKYDIIILLMLICLCFMYFWSHTNMLLSKITNSEVLYAYFIWLCVEIISLLNRKREG